MSAIAFHGAMRFAVLVLFASACGRVNFDPVDDGTLAMADASVVDGNPAFACMGGTPTCGVNGSTLSLGGSSNYNNTTAELGNGQSGSCGGANANELAVRLFVTGTGMYELTTDGSEFDTVLYVRSDCGGAELICADVPGGTETVVLPLTSGETILVVVDGAGECGMFQLTGRSL